MKSPNDKKVRVSDREVGQSLQLGLEVKAAVVDGPHTPFDGQSDRRMFYFPAPINRAVEANSQEEAEAVLARQLAAEKANQNNE